MRPFSTPLPFNTSSAYLLANNRLLTCEKARLTAHFYPRRKSTQPLPACYRWLISSGEKAGNSPGPTTITTFPVPGPAYSPRR